ncbi:MAG: hypothetical protein ACOCPN_03675, partial [Desulfonatronovibrionaceae bacterium]
MLTIKCSGCKRKLWKYKKIGPGEVLRCHKQRISKRFEYCEKDGRVHCLCGQTVGIDKGRFYKMIAKAFTYSGT